MIETELKISLNAKEAARLRRHPLLDELGVEPARTERLLSVYYDTPDHALAAAGIALRLRKIGRRWVQTVKAGRRAGGAGLFSHQEVETPAPGARLVLEGPDPAGVLAAIAEAAGAAPLSPVFETRVRRMSRRLCLPAGVVEIALDQGEVAAGEATAPILEVEMELAEGEVDAVFDLARRLFPTGPVTLATANKSALGYRLARGEAVAPELKARKAGTPDFAAEATVETVARDVFRDCFAQVATNLVVVAQSDAIEGPHQLRIGLRRLRTAFGVFGPTLGPAGLAAANDAARTLGQVVGRLRDIDVLIDEVVAGAAALGLDAPARAALEKALGARRAAVRAEVRAVLAGPETTAFVFDLLELIEARGWLAPADYSQTERLATPIGALASGLLAKRHRKVLRRGKHIETLEAEPLHELRKELKKLRYTADVLAPIFPGKKVAAYLKALKDMQDTFGSLNDAAMAAEYLAGPKAPGRDDAPAQRAVGWTLGALTVKVRDDRPALFRRWEDFVAAEPFWE